MRFVERVVAQNVGHIFHALGDLLNGVDVMALEVLLGVFALDEGVRGDGSAAEKQAEHRRRAELVVIRHPLHRGIVHTFLCVFASLRLCVKAQFLVEERRACFVQFGNLKADCFKKKQSRSVFLYQQPYC